MPLLGRKAKDIPILMPDGRPPVINSQEEADRFFPSAFTFDLDRRKRLRPDEEYLAAAG